MSKETTGYLEGFGYRKIGDAVWYRTWRITVKTGEYKEPEYPYGALDKVDLREELLRISNQYPDHTVVLWAMARGRMVAVNGAITQENAYADFYLDKDTEDGRIFDGLILSDNDGMGNYITE